MKLQVRLRRKSGYEILELSHIKIKSDLVIGVRYCPGTWWDQYRAEFGAATTERTK